MKVFIWSYRFISKGSPHFFDRESYHNYPFPHTTYHFRYYSVFDCLSFHSIPRFLRCTCTYVCESVYECVTLLMYLQAYAYAIQKTTSCVVIRMPFTVCLFVCLRLTLTLWMLLNMLVLLVSESQNSGI